MSQAGQWSRPRVVEVVILGGATLVGVAGAIQLAVLGAFVTPFRIGNALVPLAPVLAVGGNLVLVSFMSRVTGRRLLSVLPGLVWITVTFVAAASTTEGDLVLYQSNWVASVYLLSGCVTVGVAGYRLITRQPPPGQRAIRVTGTNARPG